MKVKGVLEGAQPMAAGRKDSAPQCSILGQRACTQVPASGGSLHQGYRQHWQDNTGRTALHWAADAPIKALDDFVKAQAICEGASEESLVLKQGM